MANVSPLVSNVVSAFTPSALLDFFAIPALIPCPLSFGRLPVTVDRPYSTPFRLQDQELLGQAMVRLVSLCVARCRRRPRGRDHSVVQATCAPVACVLSQSIGLPNSLSGLITGFSFFRFTSQPLLCSLLRIRVVDDSFPGGVHSRSTRDHFQVYG